MKVAKAEFEHMLEFGFTLSSSSTWSSVLQVVLVKTRYWCLYGEFRALNKIILPDRYPFPYIHDFVSALS